MADDKDTDSTESGAAARSEEPEDLEGVQDGSVEEYEAEESEADEYEADEYEADDRDATELDDDDPDLNDDEDDADGSDRELVGAGVGAGAAGASRTGESERGRRRSRSPKGHATASRRSQSEEPAKGTPMTFIRGSIAELKQVVYPTGSQLMNYFVVVLVFVLFIIGIVTAMDAGFGWVMLRVFG